MVLIRRWGVLGIVVPGLLGLLGGCSESLFGASRGGGGGDGGIDVPGSCTGTCIADASADFDGTPNGARNHWRYLEDLRNRMWVPMTGDLGGMTGSDPKNHITTCAAHPEAPACNALPLALLVSSGGTGSAADSAIEFTATAAQVIQLSLHVFVPSGDDQTIRLYRNSREDVLFTGTATAGTTLDHAITLDALAGDRFLVAVVPTGNTPAVDVGLHLTVSATDLRFPSTCQFSFPFESVTGNSTVDGSCSNGVLTLFGSTGTQATLNLVQGPFLEHGKAASIPRNTHLRALSTADVIDHAQGATVQFWVRLMPFIDGNIAWAFSDMDVDYGGGVAIWIAPIVPTGGTVATIHAQTCTNPIGTAIADAFGSYQADGSWRFVRVVHTSTSIQLCVNGARVASVDLTTPALTGMNPPELGKDVYDLPSEAFFNGSVDDLRVITGALPCN